MAQRAHLAVGSMIGRGASAMTMDQQRGEEDRDGNAQYQRQNANELCLALGRDHGFSVQRIDVWQLLSVSMPRRDTVNLGVAFVKLIHYPSPPNFLDKF